MLGIIAFLAYLQPPEVYVTAHSDDSWIDYSWSLAYGHFFRERLAAGLDYEFTYGPLGYFVTQTFDADLYWQKFAWEVALKAGFGVGLALFWIRLPAIGWQVALLAVLLFSSSGVMDSVIVFGIVGSGWLAVRQPNPAARMLALCAAAYALFAQVKFSYAIMALLWALAVALSLALRGRFVRSAAWLVGVAAAYAVPWVILGQSLFNLPAYWRSSWHIASIYPWTMGLDGPRIPYWLGVGSALALIWTVWSSQSAETGVLRVLPKVVMTASIIIQFRHGFTRHDEPHALIFFAWAYLTALVVVVDRRPGRRTAIACAAVILLAGAGLAASCFPGGTIARFRDVADDYGRKIWYLTTPWHYRASLLASTTQLRRERGLPRIKEYIGQKSVDVFSSNAALLLLSNFNWSPRPVFQAYAVGSSALARRNAAFYRAKSAPPFVLMYPQAIDLRFPGHEDGASLLEIIRRYAPRFEEKDCLLMERRKLAWSETPSQVKEREIPLGDEVAVDPHDNGYVTASIQLPATAAGKLRGWLFKPPDVWILVKSSENEVRKYRLCPTMAAGEFILSPLLRGWGDVNALGRGTGGERVLSFVLDTDSPGIWYSDRFDVTLRHYHRPNDSE